MVCDVVVEWTTTLAIVSFVNNVAHTNGIDACAVRGWHKTIFKLKKNDLDAEIAENNRKNYTELMEMQTNQAWFNLEQSWLRISMAQTALNDAKANLKITQDYYEAGLVTLSDLLEAQTMLKNSRDELSDSRVEFRLNLLRYKQLTDF